MIEWIFVDVAETWKHFIIFLIMLTLLFKLGTVAI